VKEINNIHNDAASNGRIGFHEIEREASQSFKSGYYHVLNVQKINDPPPGPLPSFERMDFPRTNGNYSMRVFPDRGPGRFFRMAMSIACRLVKSFSEKIRVIGKRSVMQYSIYPLKTPGRHTPGAFIKLSEKLPK